MYLSKITSYETDNSWEQVISAQKRNIFAIKLLTQNRTSLLPNDYYRYLIFQLTTYDSKHNLFGTVSLYVSVG